MGGGGCGDFRAPPVGGVGMKYDKCRDVRKLAGKTKRPRAGYLGALHSEGLPVGGDSPPGMLSVLL